MPKHPTIPTIPTFADAYSYSLDAWQRSILFLDVMRQRGARKAQTIEECELRSDPPAPETSQQPRPLDERERDDREPVAPALRRRERGQIHGPWPDRRAFARGHVAEA